MTRVEASWGSGPWDDEPDKFEWIDPDTGMNCHILRNRFGAWCGYVDVRPGHQAYGKNYDDVDVSIHGGLTYSADIEDAWRFGFDCAHYMDIVPGMRLPEEDDSFKKDPEWAYRDIEYAKDETTRLARQLFKFKL